MHWVILLKTKADITAHLRRSYVHRLAIAFERYVRYVLVGESVIHEN